jgi:hypothetical protein
VEAKVAVTLESLLSAKVQVPAPEQPAPLHPENVELAAGAAVRETCVPRAKLAVQVDPQLMPAGVLVTDPEPVPLSWTLSAGVAANLAVTMLLAVRVTVQDAMPEQAPPQPEK